MSITKTLLLIILMPLAPSLCAQSLPEPRTVQLNERVYVLLGPIQHANPDNQGYMVNSTVIVGDRGVILVDPGGTHAVGLHIARAIRRITAKPVTHVINTHPHGDHYLGNSAFNGATLLSSERCRAQVSESGHEWVALMEQLVGRRFPDTRPMPAQVVFREGARTPLILEGVPLVIWVPPGSHTAGDLLVHLPEDRVLVSGDVVVNGIVPVMQDGNIRNWIGTLEEIQQLDVRVIVPGHGELMTKGRVRALQHAIARFYAGVQTGYQHGLDEGTIRQSLDLTDWERLERAYVIGRNINRAYLEIEDASFDPWPCPTGQCGPR